MLSHERVWEALDALAARYSSSPSGLAKQAGLDPTAFNRSKRTSSDGRPRWPSTESLAKVFEATGASWLEFTGLMDGLASYRSDAPMLLQNDTVGFAETDAAGFFSASGLPKGSDVNWLDVPAGMEDGAYALKVQGDAMVPLYRDGDVVIVAPSAVVQDGDRVVVQTKDGEVLVRVLLHATDDQIELLTFNPAHTNSILARGNVDSMMRIIWASQ